MDFLKKKPVAWVITVAVMCLCAFFGVSKYSRLLPAREFTSHVVDKADILSDNVSKNINDMSEAWYADNGSELIVVTVADTGSLSVKKYTELLFDKWCDGAAHEGAVMLLMSVSAKTKEYHVFTDAYDKYISAQESSRVIENDFRKGDYDAAAIAFASYVNGIFSEHPHESTGAGFFSHIKWWHVLVALVVLLLVLGSAGARAAVGAAEAPLSAGSRRPR